MRKKHLSTPVDDTSQQDAAALSPDMIAEVEITSEADGFPIENALASTSSAAAPSQGWRAAGPGTQVIRLHFAHPVRLTRIGLRFEEHDRSRTQEFVLRWAESAAGPRRDIVRQQYSFSPGGATRETESYTVHLSGVSVLELEIVPEIGGGSAVATLRELRLVS